MKQTMLLLLLALCSLATVQAQEPPTFGLQANRPDRHTAPLLCPADISQDADKTLQATTRNEQIRPWRIPATVARMAEEGTAMRLDSIVTFNTDGTRNSLEAYTYDDAYRNFHHTQARYNPSTDSWEATTEYDYRLTDDNVLLLISTLTHSTNEYVIYEYDDQGWCVERKMYYKNDENTWTEQKKTEYTHDERGNTTEEMTYRLVDGQWQPSVHFIMAYDSNNRQILYEYYTWDGSNWRGGYKTEWTWYDGPNPTEYSESTRFTQATTYTWDWDNNEWKKYDRGTREYNADGYTTMSKEEHWRMGPDNETIYSAGRSFWEYDEDNICQKQEDYIYMNSTDEWIQTLAVDYEWTYDEAGNRSGHYEEIKYDVNDNGEITAKWPSARHEEGYDANGNLVWKKDWSSYSPGEELVEQYEAKYIFDGAGRLTEALSWTWENGTRVNYGRYTYTYDDEGNCTEETQYKAASTGQTNSNVATRGMFIEEADLEGWEPYEYISYHYGNGIYLGKRHFSWQNDDWTPRYGLSIEYDFEYTPEKLIVPGTWGDPYKINVIHYLDADGMGGWTLTDKVYYWTEVKATGIAQAATEGAKVTFADNVLSVAGGTEVRNLVYDLGGRLVLSGQSHREQLGHLAQGIYVVRSLVDGEAYTLKISIE